AKELGLKLFTTDADEFFAQADMDIVVEAIGGEEPALDYLKRALSGGKHVVTSNKEVIAKHGVELFALAQQYGVGLHYEASVGGGIPLIAPFQYALVANKISGIYAIINGTTNYILTRMAREGTSPLAVEKHLAHQVTFHQNSIINTINLSQKGLLRDKNGMNSHLNQVITLFSYSQQLYGKA
ncbi:unnamed protein product, partial [marine sediment metagenome]